MVRSFPTSTDRLRNRLNNTFAALLIGTLAASLSGCQCHGGNGTNTSFGEIGVVWRDSENNRIVSRDATYDFGNALTGETKNLTLTVTNTGAGKLSLTSLVLTSGDETVIAATGTATSAFNVNFSPSNLDPSSQATYDMSFTPKGLKGNYKAVLTLTGEGTRAEDATATITLLGQGEKGACDLPDTIDFGTVAVGETFPYDIPFVNPTSIDATGNTGDFMGADATAFGYAANSPKGMVSVPAKTTKNVTITFSPTEKRDYTATVVMHGPGNCPDKTITVKGTGGDATLTWTPSSLSYGFVNPGSEAIQEVVFKNPAAVPLTLTMVASSDPADFYQVVGTGGDPTKFTVLPNSQPTSMKIACNPSKLGKLTGTLTFTTGLQHPANGSIALDCTGGGPRIQVTPRPTLSFGRVGYFPNQNPPFVVTRKVNVQNVGSKPPMPDPTANLYLGSVVNGTPGIAPLFQITPTNADTDPSEFSLALGSPYNANNGIEAVAGANYVDIVVTLTPKSATMKAADLQIFSNDPSEPVVTVHVTADVQQLPPCNYSVTPAQANFGLVTPGTQKDLPITITNLGTAATDICYMSGIDLAPGTHPSYSIVGGPIVEQELQPQQSMQVVVRVAPTGATPTMLTTLSGALTMNATSPTKPQTSVPLRTSVGPSCLAVTPDPLDFGTIKIGCNSAAKTFNVYNVCSTNVTINSFAMQTAAGQPFGGPNCTNMAGCPEFRLVSTPAIPGGGLTLAPGAAPVTFQAKYSPIDTGADTGAVAINAIQNGQSITYLVGLAGQGDTVGQQTDTFVQDQQPKADILLVIDDSGSMADKQASLANNFASFIQYAVAANVDYHIGIVTTTENAQDCDPTFGCVPNTSVAIGGSLELDATLNIRYMTPSTPNVATVFKRMVNVGTSGSGIEMGFEPAVGALTPPKVTAENAGFLRTDANLAVVVVSDAGDQSAQPVSYYQNRLVNVKGFNRLSMFTFSNIGPYLASAPSGCTYDGGGDVQRYKSVVTYTSGVSDEICNTNWAATLQNLGRTVFGFRTQWYLNNTPDLTGGHTVTVQVNGVTIASGPNTWTYDSASNSVKFNPSATPGAGQTLTITYTTACF